jgi:hypothetical protein
MEEAIIMTMQETNQTSTAMLEVSGREPPPSWAVEQRYLIDLMNRAGPAFVETYTRPDGTLIWRKTWPGMDGSDDGYESFLSFPLFYILGGEEQIHQLARKAWNAVTRQFTRYGQVYREFDAYYDWMHHGESYTYIYYLALADPHHLIDRARALNFAAMYIGEDPEAPNWDPNLHMIRSPINGSKGPRFKMSAQDWVTHRPVLANYLAPYEDIPGLESTDPFVVADWNDDEVFAEILTLMNERMVPGDVPLNLNATSLITNAFLYTGEEKYRQWVLDYLDAWMERTKRNNGIMPDNIGPTGKIGERMGGKWWGGYYGWRWPHGAWIILESTLIAGCNAMLLTGDDRWLDLHRSQADLLWSLRREEDNVIKTPARYGAQGWFDYRPPNPASYIHLYAMTQHEEDLERIKTRFPNREEWHGGDPRFGKAGSYSPTAWFAYLMGEHPNFPTDVLRDTYIGICQRLERAATDSKAERSCLTGNVALSMSQAASWDVHHWQNINPVIPEGLIQMAMGTPAAVYHGGLLHARVRYFDPQCHRPGLPAHVAALVEAIRPDNITLTLVNTDPLKKHTVLIQAGTFGEHQFTDLTLNSGEHIEINEKYLQVILGPSAQTRLKIGMQRFAHTPSYQLPPMLEETQSRRG